VGFFTKRHHVYLVPPLELTGISGRSTMTAPQMKIAQLDDERLAKLRDVENELGVYLVAFQMEKPQANLSDDQVRRLYVLEEELGVILVAQQPSTGAAAP
jgi:hypothetical protein